MAFLNESGELVTQGDGELSTVTASLRLVAESAILLMPDPDKAAQLKSICNALVGKSAMLFMITPFDPTDTEPVALDAQEDTLQNRTKRTIPEFGETEHSFSAVETKLILGSLRYRCDREPVDESDEKLVACAGVMLEQVERV